MKLFKNNTSPFAISWNLSEGILTLHRRKDNDVIDENTFNLKQDEFAMFVETLLENDLCRNIIKEHFDSQI